MRFENTFDVDAPIERVWDAVLDVERVAPTVPGAQVLERTGEDSYKVAIKVKVGPMSMTYRGEVEITERDEDAHRAVMKARAKESRGQGTANADVTMALSGEDGRTSATVTTDVELSGKVATMGQGVLQDVSGRLVQTFAQNLAAMLEAGEPQATEVPARPAEEAAGAEQPATAAAAAGSEQPTTAAAAAGSEQPTRAAPAAGAEQAGAAESRADGAAAAVAAAERPAAGEGERRAAEPAEALDLGALGGEMLADRLRDPRALGGLLAFVALVAFLLGRRSAR